MGKGGQQPQYNTIMAGWRAMGSKIDVSISVYMAHVSIISELFWVFCGFFPVFCSQK